MILSFFLCLSLSKHYVTFDVYGTLLNISYISDVIMQIATENEIDPFVASAQFDECEDMMVYGENYTDFNEKLRSALMWTDIYLNVDVFEKSYDRIIQAYHDLKPFPEVIDALEEMQRRNYTIVIMSNSVHSLMDVNQHALGDLFNITLLAQDAKAFKPDLKFFQYVHDKLNFDKNNHTHIAQGYWSDIMPAMQMNWPNRIWVNRANHKYVDKYPCNVVYNLTQALDYLPPIPYTEDESDDDEGDTTPFVKSWKMIAVCVSAAVLIVAVIVTIILCRNKRKKSNLTSNSALLVT